MRRKHGVQEGGNLAIEAQAGERTAPSGHASLSPIFGPVFSRMNISELWRIFSPGRSLMPFRVFVGPCFALIVINLAGCAGSTGSRVQSHDSLPLITTQPASQTLTAGQRATFTVVATGTAPLSYQWQKNSTNISGTTSSSYTTPATTTADNNSTFDVVVTNAVGSVTSNTATLMVTPLSSVNIITNGLPTGQVQAAYTFPLQATGGTPPYTWSALGSSLPAGLILLPSSAIIAGIPTASGTFTLNVQVSDGVGGSTAAAIPMSIATPPPPPPAALFGHVFLVVEENHNYREVVGSVSMHYLNGLIDQFGLATQYFANTHPSIGNYFILTLSRPISWTAAIIHIKKKRVTTRFQGEEFRQHQNASNTSGLPTCPRSGLGPRLLPLFWICPSRVFS